MNLLIKALEIILLLAVSVPALHLVTDRGLLRHFPRLHLTLALLLLGWFLLILILALFIPTLLTLFSLCALAVLVLWAIAAGTIHYQARGAPPGSLSIVDGLGGITDREFYLKQSKRYGPIFKFAQFSHKVIAMVGLERGQKLFREHDADLISTPLPFSKSISGGFLRYMNDEDHALYGKLFRKALGKSVTDAALPLTNQVTEHQLARLAGDCANAPSHTVAPSPYLVPIVRAAFFRALYGIEPETPQSEKFLIEYEKFTAQPPQRPISHVTLQALSNLREMLYEKSNQLCAENESLCALTSLHLQNPNMPDATCLDNLLFAQRIGSGNILGLLHWLLVMVGTNPVWLEELRARVANGNTDAIDATIMETLRLAQSEYLYRKLDKEIDYEGYRLPKGWLLRVCVWESHRDPNIFPEPNQFNPNRFLEKHYTASDYSPFGFAKHACNGVALTNLVCRSVLHTIVTQYEIQVFGQDSLARDFRHWNHWHPGANFQVRLTPLVNPI